MIYTGYVTLPTTTYNDWRSATINNYFDADQAYQYQCWDLVAEFYWNIGFPTGYPLTGPNGYAYECWSVSRNSNVGHGISLVYDITTIKRGDIIVINQTAQIPTGHIGFADEDYNSTGYINILGQNQIIGDQVTCVTNWYIADKFLGVFRYDPWNIPPGPGPWQRGKFPWVLYARKLRDKCIDK